MNNKMKRGPYSPTGEASQMVLTAFREYFKKVEQGEFKYMDLADPKCKAEEQRCEAVYRQAVLKDPMSKNWQRSTEQLVVDCWTWCESLVKAPHEEIAVNFKAPQA